MENNKKWFQITRLFTPTKPNSWKEELFFGSDEELIEKVSKDDFRAEYENRGIGHLVTYELTSDGKQLRRIDLALKYLKRVHFEPGDVVQVWHTEPLPGKKVGPKFQHGTIVLNVFTDSAGYQHLDIGIKTDLNFITSYETGEKLPSENNVHWCHPLRFHLVKKVEKKTE